MDRLSDLEVFLAVVDQGSITAAARSLGLSKSYVSKRVRGLEDRLKTRLLHRTTRALTPTTAGTLFYERVAAAMEDLHAAERLLLDQHDEPIGRLRVSLPVSFGLRHVTPVLAQLCTAHNGLQFELNYTDRKVDLVDQGIDLAIRLGRLSDSSMVARKLGEMRQVVVTSPAYLERHGTAPTHPDDLPDHDCLIYDLTANPRTWELHHDTTGEVTRTKVDGRFVADNGDALVVSLLQGIGVAIMPDFFLAGHLASGELVRVLPEWQSPRAGIWAVYPHRQHASPKLRVVVEALAEAFSDPPWSLGAH